jgi:predicted ABC-type exoprotein transport system permease subunit
MARSTKKANNTQVAGSHYNTPIQVWDFVYQNGMDYISGNIVKYVARFRDKNGLEDLYKARHYLDKLIEEVKEEENEK